MSYTALTTPALPISPRLRLTDRYVQLLCLSLAGYACLGKGFAYVGISPLFIGEIVLLLGMLVLVRTGCGIAALATLPSLLLAILTGWVLAEALPSLGKYGFDTLRDSVIVVYGLFAFIVIALLLEKPQRLGGIVTAYSSFVWFYGLANTFLLNIENFIGRILPVWPQAGVPIVYLRLGEAAVHVTGATVFVLLGLRRVSKVWILILLLSIIAIIPSRGAMLSWVIPVGVAAIVSRKLRRFAPILLLGGVLFAAAYALGVEIPIPGGRTVGPQQLIENVESIIGTSEATNLDGTKQWRLRWWQTIVNYTIHGPYLWTGKGFGMSLAEADGFVVGQELGGPVLRSPHNANLTILARSGFPGLTLWALTIVAWFTLLLCSSVTARRRGDRWFADVFLWIACYVLAALIDAAFDVALEGPMIGIWFWCLFGFGIGSTMIYRTAIANAPPARRRSLCDPPKVLS